MNRTAVLLLHLVIISICLGDGFHIGRRRSRRIPLPEPKQKAVINWDGTTETMLLSSYVKLDDLDDIAWIVPILSSEVPKISKGEEEIYKDLHRFLYPSQSIFDRRSAGVSGFGGGSTARPKPTVKVIASDITIDYFYITIVKASNASDLVTWLQKNKYNIRHIKEDVLRYYTDQENCYFIITRINLLDSFSEEIKTINKTFKDNKQQLLNPHLTILEKINAQLQDKKINRRMTLDSVDVKKILGNGSYLRNYFHTLCLEHINSNPKQFHIPINPLDSLPYKVTTINEAFDAWYFDTLIHPLNDVSRTSDNPLFDSLATFKEWMLTVERESLQYITKHYNERYREIHKKHGPNYGRVSRDQLIDFYRELGVLTNINRDTSEAYSLPQKLILLRKDLKFQYDFTTFEMQKLNNVLRGNLSTPLLFSFKPPEPYFPLYISSMGSGKSDIRVYYIADTVSTAKEVLKDTKSKKITDEYVKLRVKHSLKVPSEKYVTELTWKGKLEDLDTDAFFIPKPASPNDSVSIIR